VQKLFPLTSTVIAATVGAGYGILLVENFMRFVQHAKLQDFESISYSAAAFFQRGIDLVRGENVYAPHRDELDKVYFLVAGVMPRQPKNPLRFLVLASEGRSDPLHILRTSNVVSIPRQVGIEYRLVQLLRSERRLDHVEKQLESFLRRLADSDDAIGPPFQFARISLGGISIGTRDRRIDFRLDKTALRRRVTS
jgi:hypothetical protein